MNDGPGEQQPQNPQNAAPPPFNLPNNDHNPSNQPHNITNTTILMSVLVDPNIERVFFKTHLYIMRLYCTFFPPKLRKFFEIMAILNVIFCVTLLLALHFQYVGKVSTIL
jgi:hypothetical protein